MMFTCQTIIVQNRCNLEAHSGESTLLCWPETEPTGSILGPYVYVYIFNKVFELHGCIFSVTSDVAYV